ncbi:aquaporin [Streptomyces sp. H10-C2]|uniref:aquaporin n=1 Tax=unclassified Streptomyces TaxID=2593676 RepID=UPI0024BBDFBE|nr:MULTISPECIES: aquaporin [unclassified Streptomyces]MDJ0340257.1 aquaporin [Streptomyces sp. PH10-H1]MDJ0368294.1 aquaporin [Streptomyces sp. H10-C2]
MQTQGADVHAATTRTARTAARTGVPPVRKAAAELVGTAALVAIVVGSGIQASRLSHDVGIQLLANVLATALGLWVLITLLAPVSGAHLNPVVTLADWWTARGGPAAHRGRTVALYIAAQTTGAITGSVLSAAMFDRPLISWSAHDLSAGHLLLGEVVATTGLVLLVTGLTRTGRPQLAPTAVATYIGAACLFTSSSSFANPAATVGRSFTGTFTGIAPGSLPGFIAAQLTGTVLGLALAAVLFTDVPADKPRKP